MLKFHKKLQDFDRSYEIGELIDSAKIINEMVKYFSLLVIININIHNSYILIILYNFIYIV